jgi:hypothetical protein
MDQALQALNSSPESLLMPVSGTLNATLNQVFIMIDRVFPLKTFLV